VSYPIDIVMLKPDFFLAFYFILGVDGLNVAIFILNSREVLSVASQINNCRMLVCPRKSCGQCGEEFRGPFCFSLL